MKYEYGVWYLVQDNNDDLLALLNELGAARWKLSQTIVELTGSGAKYKGIFIREVVVTKKK